jgi:hypothetical protein
MRPPTFVADAAPAVDLPPGRRMGPVVGLAQAPDGHIWVLHITGKPEYFPPALRDDPGSLLPPVVELDAAGKFLRAWGGPDHLPREDGLAQWPRQEETISIDAEGAIWIFGADVAYDHAVQRFTPEGELLLRIGRFGEVGDDASPDRLGCPTDAWHDVARREVYVTDGYVNHRVAVFASDTGRFLRAWGAYGESPPRAGDGRAAFNNPVHAISLGPDGLLYVCDRKNDRVQVFDAVGREAPRFVRELGIAAESPFGAAFNLAFTPDGAFMLVNDGNNSRIWLVEREAWRIAGAFQGPASETAGLEATIHKIMVDRAGDLWLGRTSRGVEKMRRA